MKIRVISGACFVAIVTGFFLLREFVDARLFSIFLWFLCTVGAFEMARAARQKTGDGIYLISIIFGFLTVPVYCVTEYFVCPGYGYVFALITMLCALVFNLGLLTTNPNKKAVIGYATLDALYPSALILFMLLINGLSGDKGFIAMLLTFVISPFSDTFAYFVGSLCKGPKLCPRLSPKKTWSGAIGGTLGGAIGSIIVFFVFGKALGGYFTWWVFLLLGLVASVLTIIGDLFESFIKRRLEIKDMGKIMPGHGGVLDRIDGTTFASVIIFITFAVL
ncbi:MAG: CDP-archaeol synthase [Clostridia bacterium]|nr:CDP-archaeol synthase [Clostridia bacterium]